MDTELYFDRRPWAHLPTAFIDLETSALSPEEGGPCEVGLLIRVEGETVLHQTWWVDPGHPLGADTVEHCGYGLEELEAIASAPAWPDVWPEVLAALATHGVQVAFAYNASFDMGHIGAACSRAGMDGRQPVPVLDMMAILRQLYPRWRSHSLKAAVQEFALPAVERGERTKCWLDVALLAGLHAALSESSLLTPALGELYGLCHLQEWLAQRDQERWGGMFRSDPQDGKLRWMWGKCAGSGLKDTPTWYLQSCLGQGKGSWRGFEWPKYPDACRRALAAELALR